MDRWAQDDLGAGFKAMMGRQNWLLIVSTSTANQLLYIHPPLLSVERRRSKLWENDCLEDRIEWHPCLFILQSQSHCIRVCSGLDQLSSINDKFVYIH
ncbi:hypothetical protein H6P81_001470 [Aristolochia fimbriata]|uniref:Uncharacterized protein n=1 Tax=Aristolochia fimbriata TaxID=158543 RepID=A0AAV7FB09_ARIFI|nr:hypothetical protein H6P81_001470 [Aristolochia fimbriata]